MQAHSHTYSFPFQRCSRLSSMGASVERAASLIASAPLFAPIMIHPYVPRYRQDARPGAAHGLSLVAIISHSPLGRTLQTPISLDRVVELAARHLGSIAIAGRGRRAAHRQGLQSRSLHTLPINNCLPACDAIPTVLAIRPIPAIAHAAHLVLNPSARYAGRATEYRRSKLPSALIWNA